MPFPADSFQNPCMPGPPPEKYAHLEPEREEVCAACGCTGYRTVDGWSTETRVDNDGDGSYLTADGESLDDAGDTPMGWVCGKTCRSQAMYNAADEYDRKSLRKVRDACRVLAEQGRDALDLVNRLGEDMVSDSLMEEAGTFLRAIEDGFASWCNEESREDRLEQTVRNAAFRAQRIAQKAAWPVLLDEVDNRQVAQVAASAARLALDLKAAEEGRDE